MQKLWYRSGMKCLAVIAAIGMLFSAGQSHGADPEWAAAKVQLEKLVSEEKCEEYWSTIWPYAKTGNLEARMVLLTFLAPPVHGTQIIPPGSTGDLVSKLRDIIIMAVHSSDYTGSEDFNQYYKDLAYDLYLKQGFEESVEGREFLKCVTEKANDCAAIAVKEKLVPSFDDYAKQIDLYTTSGMKSSCEPAYKISR